MASEQVLKELFQVSVSSDYFKGMDKEEVWEACLSYKDRSDRDIKIAMENIRKQDIEADKKSEKTQEALERNKEKLMNMRSQEKTDREKDIIIAESILDNFFEV